MHCRLITDTGNDREERSDKRRRDEKTEVWRVSKSLFDGMIIDYYKNTGGWETRMC